MFIGIYQPVLLSIFCGQYW